MVFISLTLHLMTLTEPSEDCSMQNKFYFPTAVLRPIVVCHRVSSVLSVTEILMSKLHCIDVCHSREQRDEPNKKERKKQSIEMMPIDELTSSSCRRNVRFSLLAHSMFSWHNDTCKHHIYMHLFIYSKIDRSMITHFFTCSSFHVEEKIDQCANKFRCFCFADQTQKWTSTLDQWCQCCNGERDTHTHILSYQVSSEEMVSFYLWHLSFLWKHDQEQEWLILWFALLLHHLPTHHLELQAKNEEWRRKR